MYGLRAHGGFGDVMEKKPFLRDKVGYAGRIIFDLSFYIIIIVFLLNIVFGIIIDTFRQLRMNSQKKEWDELNKCIICGSKREELEMHNEDFEQHCNGKHNIWNYIYYIILLKSSDPQDLNAVNSYALDNINRKMITWIPNGEENQEGDGGNDE